MDKVLTMQLHYYGGINRINVHAEVIVAIQLFDED